MATKERIIIRWAGGTHDVEVLKRFKNGNIKVLVKSGRWMGGRAGTASSDTIVTIEPWQVLNLTADPAPEQGAPS